MSHNAQVRIERLRREMSDVFASLPSLWAKTAAYFQSLSNDQRFAVGVVIVAVVLTTAWVLPI